MVAYVGDSRRRDNSCAPHLLAAGSGPTPRCTVLPLMELPPPQPTNPCRISRTGTLPLSSLDFETSGLILSRRAAALSFVASPLPDDLRQPLTWTPLHMAARRRSPAVDTATSFLPLTPNRAATPLPRSTMTKAPMVTCSSSISLTSMRKLKVRPLNLKFLFGICTSALLFFFCND